MGYCPFEHKAGLRRALGAGRRWAQVEARRALGEQAQSSGALHDAEVRLGARGEQAAGGRWAQAQARGAGACGSRRTGARQQVHGRAERVRQQAHGRAELARHRLGRACARLGVLSWARLGVLCTLTQFLTRFDSVLFLSH